MKRRSNAGGLVPLEKAAKARATSPSRLPALNPQAAKQSDIGRRFKAVVEGRSRPASRAEKADEGQSKYADEDKKEE